MGNSSPFTLQVECYSGHRGEEEPRRLLLGDRATEVVDILDRWLAPDHRYFKVKGHRGEICIVRHDCERDQWELTMYERGARESRDD